ncbi:DUF116 domain-containing protein [Candidatus Bathyarchaeota archaeon]|nr:DUF116 domain-containing protein [Candidatus Bathyarchaeota archaeon]
MKFLSFSNKEKEGALMRLIEKLSENKVGEFALIKFEQLAAKSGVDEKRLLTLYLKAKNLAYKGLFSKIPFSDRVLLLPQCLRPKGCLALFGEFGYECKGCENCKLGELINFAKKLGYKGVYLISGGSVVSKIFEKIKPKACIGVACLKELVLGSFVAEKFGVIVQCIALSKDGCVNTEVEWNAVERVVELK